jgi:TonB-linked SusC/RagA family outer membrane protein
MKLTIFLLLAGLLQVSARTRAQTVTYSGKAVPLTTVFSEIRKQTGYLFFYRKEDLAGSGPVTLQLRNTPLQDALAQALTGQPLSFSIQGNTIFITLKPVGAAVSPENAGEPPPTGVHGRVMDSLGTPLAGASVTVKGSKRGTVTDAWGDFELKGVPENVTLVISFTGYGSKEYKVKDGNRFFVRLDRSTDPLDEIQVVAYGTNTRRFSVGSIATVTSEDIQKQPVSNVLLALEGRVAGLVVTPSSGSPGAYSPVQIRGQNTLISNIGGSTSGQSLNRLSTNVTTPYDQPLFIVDGVPFAPGNQNISVINALGGYNNLVPNGGISSLGGLNPSDIESVTVLKDADATSIYGSQGANGVIVITTKKGRPGKTNFNARVNAGPNNVTRSIPMMNTQQYLAMRREAAQNDGLTVTAPGNSSLFPDLLVFDSTRSVDWFRKWFGGTAYNTDAYASLTGGTTNSTFLLSGGYTRANYNYPGSFADNRVTLHSGFHYNSPDRRLTVDFGTDYSYDHNISPSAPPSGAAAMMMPPNLPDLIDPQGKLIWTYKGADLSSFQQFSYLKQPSGIQTYGINGSLRVGYQLARGLNISTNVGYSRVNTKQHLELPLSSLSPKVTSASATFANTDYQSVNIEPQIDYNRNIGKGSFSALLGGTFKSNTSSGTTLVGDGYVNDALLGTITAATTVSAYDAYNIYKYAGVFGRLGYIYDREFIVSLSGRRDGSSNFGPGRQFGTFGSAGLGWIFSEEKAFQHLLPIVSYAKISGNYGTNGSDGVAPYRFQDFWKLASSAIPLFQGTRGYVPGNLFNPDYGWSTKRSINIGLDLGFFHDRLLTNATWYRARTGNQLVNYPLPNQTGFSSVVENLHATVQDAGLEITVSSVNIKSRSFKWTTTFNIAANRNKLIAFPGLSTSTYASVYSIGKPVSSVFGFKYAGINDTTGIFQFVRTKGGVTSIPSGVGVDKGGDIQSIVDLSPKYSGGFGNTFTYGGFSLTAFFHFTKQMGRNYLGGLYSTVLPGRMYDLPTLAEDRWRKPGDHSSLERLTTGSGTLGSQASRAASYFNSSSGAYSDASYIRLQNLSLAYAFPAGYLKKAGIKNASIYINAQNVFTITSYKVGDPQTPGSLYGIPLQRIIMGGISLDF